MATAPPNIPSPTPVSFPRCSSSVSATSLRPARPPEVLASAKSAVNKKPMRLRTNGSVQATQAAASSSTSSRRSTNSTKITIASASAIHAARDIVNRQPKHMQNAQIHAAICSFRFFVQ